MHKANYTHTLFLLSTVVSLGAAGCHSRGSSQLASNSVAPTVSGVALKEIHVDQSCHILQDQVHGVTGGSESGLAANPEICHLESVSKSDHPEETTVEGVARHSVVSIAEQEYLLQNVTAEPVTFVVEQAVPQDWQIDSDPRPTEIVGSTALFRVSAQPGQRVRLHVGMRRKHEMSTLHASQADSKGN
ncbi:hypothetical protein [Granulicella sp. dw_53]|uniref:hypothetical protein n=1 Tax=Granulicella sp. dw_53 TaxID=2719792 RepID=UPI001BD1CD54|nr:hypothetical protein [Granulicella sp. dw_53]